MEHEDYVSFEVAKLLEEKGFDEPTWTRYEDNDEVIFGDKYNWNNSPMGQTSAPTHQMACKWLRENHNVFIEMKRDNQYYLGMPVTPMTKEDKERGHKSLYYANVLNEKADFISTEKKESYEDAVEEALKIALKNEMYLK